MPFFSARAANVANRDRLLGPLIASWRVSIFIAGAVTAVAFATAPWLLRVWLDDDFAVASLPAYMAFIGTYGLNAVNVVPYYYLLGRGRPGLVALPALLGSAAILAGIALLTPVAGLLGASLASLAYPLICLMMIPAATKITRGYSSSAGFRQGLTGFVAAQVLAGLGGLIAGLYVYEWFASPASALFLSGLATALLVVLAVRYGYSRGNPLYRNAVQLMCRVMAPSVKLNDKNGNPGGHPSTSSE
jgi:O-antigen/teichoic acid export membrane protein